MLRKSLFLFFIFTVACSHEVYRLDVDSDLHQEVTRELFAECGENCQMQNCWMETKDLVVCNVEFDFTSNSSQIGILQQASEDLQMAGLDIGFCGRDSASTKLVFAFLGGATGAVSSHFGGNGAFTAAMISASAGGAHESQDRFFEACSSPPIEGMRKQSARMTDANGL